VRSAVYHTSLKRQPEAPKIVISRPRLLEGAGALQWRSGAGYWEVEVPEFGRMWADRAVVTGLLWRTAAGTR
jgi:hypothetical protein